MADRTFTLEEAQTLVPVLGSLLRKALEDKKKLEAFEEEFQQLASKVFLSGGMIVNIEQVKASKDERDSVFRQMKDTLSEIEATGVQVKDLDIGLLDFPCVVDGETILLCWKLGEENISYWHSVEDGFKGRKLIDERIQGTKRKPS